MSAPTKSAAGGVVEVLDALDFDARTNYDLACAREARDGATKEDVDGKRIALRIWESLGEARATVEAMAEALAECMELLPDRGLPGIAKDKARQQLAAYHGSSQE